MSSSTRRYGRRPRTATLTNSETGKKRLIEVTRDGTAYSRDAGGCLRKIGKVGKRPPVATDRDPGDEQP